MTSGIRFGVIVLQDMPWSELLQLWRKFDELGFDSTWVADHFVNYANPTSPWFEGWTALAGLASVTSNIRIGTLVTSIPLRNPAFLARQALTVDHISGGRLELGIGAGAPGEIDPTYRMTGIDDWPPDERIRRLREQVEIIDKLLTTTTTSYNGEFYSLEEAIMNPRPVQTPRPPLAIAAHVKGSLRIVAEFADTWVSYGANFGAPVDIVLEKTIKRSELLEKYSEDIGRDPASIRRLLLIFGQEANTAFASEKHFTEIVERYTAIGITDLVFFYPFFAPEQIPIFEKIARDTIPSLR
ncbi:MAG: LLM class flavin-dependent oxidoreductase [Candidatus Thorarchaeota archaeon]